VVVFSATGCWRPETCSIARLQNDRERSKVESFGSRVVVTRVFFRVGHRALPSRFAELSGRLLLYQQCCILKCTPGLFPGWALCPVFREIASSSKLGWGERKLELATNMKSPSVLVLNFSKRTLVSIIVLYSLPPCPTYLCSSGFRLNLAWWKPGLN